MEPNQAYNYHGNQGRTASAQGQEGGRLGPIGPRTKAYGTIACAFAPCRASRRSSYHLPSVRLNSKPQTHRGEYV